MVLHQAQWQFISNLQILHLIEIRLAQSEMRHLEEQPPPSYMFVLYTWRKIRIFFFFIVRLLIVLVQTDRENGS